jgi:transposase
MSTTNRRAEKLWAEIRESHGVQNGWLTSAVAQEYAGVVKSTLLVWSKKGCPVLGGRRLQCKPCNTHRAVQVYRKADLDEILQARSRLPIPAGYRNPDWATYEQAARLAGCGQRYLRKIIQERGITTKKEPAVLSNGSPIEITVVLKQDVVKLASRRRPLPIPKNRIPIREAARKFGLSHRTVYGWIPSCPHLDGRALDVLECPIRHRGQIKPMLLLARAQVEEIERRMLQGPAQPLTDEQGTWCPIDSALKRYKNARRHLLYVHKNKPCPQLGGDILHAKKFRRMVSTTHRKPMVLAFLETDLQRLTPPTLGGRRGHKDPIGLNGRGPFAPSAANGLAASATQTARKRRGRPSASEDQRVKDRRKKIVDAWNESLQGKSKPSISQIATACSVDRSTVRAALQEAGIDWNQQDSRRGWG